MGIRVFDSLFNLITGLGTAKDPTTASQYHLKLLNRNDVENAYRSDWIAKRIIDAPAEDATRAWRSWQASQDQIQAIEDEEKRLDIMSKMKLAIIRARLYGGAALVLGVKQGQADEELDLDLIGEGDLEFVVVMNRYELMAGPRIYDVTSPFYTRPEYYTVATPTYGVDSAGKLVATKPGTDASRTMTGMVNVHPSRVIEFTGNELPDWRLAPMGGGWGDSVLQTVDDALKDIGMIVGGIANMVNDAKMDVIKIPDFSKNMATTEYANRLLTRFSYVNQAKSTINSVLLDREEEWARVTTNFASLPDVLHEFITFVAGGADIPVSRLIGQSPGRGLGGANATTGGDSDLRNYFDRISSKQKTEYAPRMAPLDQVLVRSALGTYDEKIYYDWNPLWQMSDTEKAELAAKKATSTKLDVDMGLINEDALRQARVNQLIEDGTYPGFEDAIEEFGSEPEEEDIQVQWSRLAGAAPPALPGPPKQLAPPKTAAADAAPRTLYVRRDVLNGKDIVTWAKKAGFQTTVPFDDMHVTIAYSKTPVDWMAMGEPSGGDVGGSITVPPGGARQLDMYGQPTPDIVVLLFNSSTLSWRHEEMVRKGASSDRDTYQPHISISFKVPKDLDWKSIDPYRGEIVLGPEIFQEIKPNWRSRVTEDGLPRRKRRKK